MYCFIVNISCIIDLYENTNIKDANNILEFLPSVLQNYLFERAWILRGAKSNLHFDYGRLIFVGDEADSQENLTIHDKIYILERLQEKFTVNLYRNKILFLDKL